MYSIAMVAEGLHKALHQHNSETDQ